MKDINGRLTTGGYFVENSRVFWRLYSVNTVTMNMWVFEVNRSNHFEGELTKWTEMLEIVKRLKATVKDNFIGKGLKGKYFCFSSLS